MNMHRTVVSLVAAAVAFIAAAPTGVRAQSSFDNLAPCTVGLSVKDFLRYPATIVAVDEAKGSYNIRRENGETYWTSPNALQVTFSCRHVAKAGPPKTASLFMGTWDMFIGSAVTTSARDPKKGEYGPGGKGGGLTVSADGTYNWVDAAGAAVSGRWRERAAAEVSRGAKPPAIVLMRGRDGYDWQMSTEGKVSNDNREQVSVDQLPGGVTILATRR